ncbi:hypothetical protein N431DRAFT_459097 [Stipitochalara longipes BDJ]|nr:hypothetical protein N431DRAFT_459097 [Stipitochalara longipes BDJ]
MYPAVNRPYIQDMDAHISTLSDGVSLPAISDRSRAFFEPDNNDERRSKRTSMPSILNPGTVSLNQGNIALPSISTIFNDISLSKTYKSRAPSVLLALEGTSPTTNTIYHLAASSILKKAAPAQPIATASYPSSSRSNMSLDYILNDPNLRTGSFTRTGGHIAQLAPTLHQPPLTRRMAIDFICNSTNLTPFLTDLDFNKLVVSTATFRHFKEYQRRTLLSFDCIEIIAPVSPRRRTPFENHFKTVTFDLSNLPDDYVYSVAPEAGWLIMTSSCPKQLIVKDKLNRCLRGRNNTLFDFDDVETCLGIRPITISMADGIYWIWKHDTGEKLSWSSWTCRKSHSSDRED